MCVSRISSFWVCILTPKFNCNTKEFGNKRLLRGHTCVFSEFGAYEGLLDVEF